MYDFKKGYQPKTNIVRDEKNDVVADYHNILSRWRNQGTRRCCFAITFELCFRVCHSEGSGKQGWLKMKWYTSALILC